MSPRAEMSDADIVFFGGGLGLLALIVSRVTEISFELAAVGAVGVLLLVIAFD